MENRERPGTLSRRAFLRAAAAIGGVGLAGALASCGVPGVPTDGPGLGSTTGSGAPPPGESNIVVWFWDFSVLGVEGTALAPAVAAFTAKQPRIKVKVEKQDYDETHKKLLAALGSGSGAPNVCAIGRNYVGALQAKKGLLDLLQPPYEAVQFKNAMVASAWAQGSSANGHLIAMPWDVAPAAIWYRADILAAAGLESDPAKLAARVMSWDDWLQMAHELKQKRPHSALIGDPASDLFSPLVEQQGYGWIDGSKVVVAEKATKPAEMAVDVRRRDLDANILGGSQWVESMSNGAIAGGVAPSGVQGLFQRDFPQTRGKWRVIPVPGGSFSMGGTFLTIPEQSPNKAAAWEFVKFVCCTTEGSNTLLRTAGIFPAYQPAWRDRLYDEPVDFFGGQAVFRLWAGIAAKLPAATLSRHDAEIDGIVFEELRNALDKTKAPAQAMKDAQATVLKRFPA